MLSFLNGLIHLMRPAEWTKSFGNMIIAVIIASYVIPVSLDFNLFLYGFIAVAALWSGLYTLNDYTDWEADLKHKVKKFRPIPSGKVLPRHALIFAIFLILFSFLIAFSLNFYFLICLTAMLVNQIFYTLKPFNLKKKAPFDLISGSLINPFFRFYAGWTLFVPNFSAPLLAVLFVLGVQFGGYALYRLSSKQHEQKLGYKSSAAVFGERKIRILSYFSLIIGALSFTLLSFNELFRLNEQVIGFLPSRFALLAFVSLFFLPIYWNALRRPHQADIGFLYRAVYFHNFLFIAGFIALYLFF